MTCDVNAERHQSYYVDHVVVVVIDGPAPAAWRLCV